MKVKTIILIVALILVLALIKIFWLNDSAGEKGKGDMKKGQPVSVTAYIVRPQSLDQEIFASGTVLANESVQLRPEVPGRLSAVYFKEGSVVNKGTLLAKMNDADLQAQLRKLQLQLKLANEREERLKALLEIKGVSREEYDAASNNRQTIMADIDYTKAQIAKTEIRAPFTGKIGLKQKSEGSYLTNTDVVAEMQQLDVLKIDFTIPEKYASIVAVGDLIRFDVEAKTDTFQAKVYAIEPRIDEQTRNISIRALYDNSGARIFPGAFAKVQLRVSNKPDVLMVPTEAVIPELKGKRVFVSQAGVAKSVMVETGYRGDAQIEITKGLKAGDTLITTGIMSLKPESKIKLIQIK